MIKIVLTSVLMFLSFLLQAQNDAIAKFFSQYMDDTRFSSIYVSGKMFNMFSRIPLDKDEQELKEVISKLGGLRILSSDKVDGNRIFQEAKRNLSTKGFEELMFVKESGKPELQFFIKEANGKINELLMLSGSENDFFMLSLVGEIDLEQISKLSKSLHIQGIENLEKIEKK